MELDIALYNLSTGGGVITSHQLSLQHDTPNRKVSNVSAGEKIREQRPDKSKENLIFILNCLFVCLFFVIRY